MALTIFLPSPLENFLSAKGSGLIKTSHLGLSVPRPLLLCAQQHFFASIGPLDSFISSVGHNTISKVLLLGEVTFFAVGDAQPPVILLQALDEPALSLP